MAEVEETRLPPEAGNMGEKRLHRQPILVQDDDADPNAEWVDDDYEWVDEEEKVRKPGEDTLADRWVSKLSKRLGVSNEIVLIYRGCRYKHLEI